MNKKFLSYILILIILVCFSGCKGTNKNESTSSNSSYSESNLNYSDNENIYTAENIPDYANNGYYGKQLSGDQRIIYNTLVHYGKNNIEYKPCLVQGLSGKEIDFGNVPTAVVFDYPEIFYFDKAVSARFEKGSGELIIEQKYDDFWTAVTDKQEKLALFNQTVDNIVDMANTYSNDFERALFVHDYLIDKAVYDFDIIKKPSDQWGYAAGAYSCLIDKKTICEGFSKAYKLVLDRLGIECIIVADEKGDEPHAWNNIKLDGEWYIVDLTYDNSAKYDENPENNHNSHEYFCAKQDEYSRKAEWANGNPTVPECNGQKYNYHKYYGYYVDEYSFDAVKEVINDQDNSGIATVKFSNKTEFQKAVKDLIDDNKMWNISSLGKYKNINITQEETPLVISFFKSDDNLR